MGKTIATVQAKRLEITAFSEGLTNKKEFDGALYGNRYYRLWS